MTCWLPLPAASLPHAATSRPCGDFNRPGLLSKSAAILAVLEQASKRARGPASGAPSRPDDSPGALTVANLLSAALGQLSAANKVAGSLVWSVSDVKHLIRWYCGGRPEHDRPALLEGWRGQLCGQTLVEVLEGRRTFRVVDPTSEYPLALDPAGGKHRRLGLPDLTSPLEPLQQLLRPWRCFALAKLGGGRSSGLATPATGGLQSQRETCGQASGESGDPRRTESLGF